MLMLLMAAVGGGSAVVPPAAVGDVAVVRAPTAPRGYIIGDGTRLTATFWAVATNAVADPTDVTLTVRKPDDTVSVVDVVRTATGIYYGDITLDQAGVWWYRFAGTGALVAVDENAINVAASKVV